MKALVWRDHIDGSRMCIGHKYAVSGEVKVGGLLQLHEDELYDLMDGTHTEKKKAMAAIGTTPVSIELTIKLETS